MDGIKVKPPPKLGWLTHTWIIKAKPPKSREINQFVLDKTTWFVRVLSKLKETFIQCSKSDLQIGSKQAYMQLKWALSRQDLP